MNTRERRILDKALEISKSSSCNQKHGAVIAAGNRILSVAVNTDRNHPNVCSDPKREAGYHAEVNAIKQLRGIDLSQTTIYSARTNKQGNAMLAKPCILCEEAIRKAGIKKVIHS